MTTSVFAFIIVLGVLVFFHELGHFLVARLCGVGVTKFSLGFGPRIVGRIIGRTDYRISAIPLGGYVKMVGDEPGSQIDPSDIPFSFNHKSLSRRIAIVAAGPMFNLALAWVIFCGLFLVTGTYVLNATIGDVRAGSPAEQAGMIKGDRVISIDDQPVGAWDDMARQISKSQGRPITIAIDRAGDRQRMVLQPELAQTQTVLGETTDRYVIGVTSAGDITHRELGPVNAIRESLYQCWSITRLTVVSIVKLIQGRLSAKTLGGPIMIAEMAGQQASEGAANLLFFIAVLSINLAVLNFLPIPVLDGGHLLFFMIEAVMRRPLSTRAREIANQGGMAVLIALMIFVFYNDISRILLG